MARDGLTERQGLILDHIHATGFATIEALAETFAVSMQTIRRDLIELEQQDLLIRFHGGAGLARNMIRLGHADKSATAQDSKQRIAKQIAQMIPNGATVYLDVGSTVECVARALGTHGQLRIVTASASVGVILSQFSQLDVFLTGGSLRGTNASLVGEHAKQTLAGLRFDYLVSSFGGFDPEGEPMDFDPEKIALRRIAMSNSLHRIGAVDSSKFQRHALARLADGTPFTELVTDAPPPPHILAGLKKSGTRLVLAQTEA